MLQARTYLFCAIRPEVRHRTSNIISHQSSLITHQTSSVITR
jgi:hypothetical protein